MSRREAVAAVAHLGLTSDLMVFWTGTTVRGGERCVGGGGETYTQTCARALVLVGLVGLCHSLVLIADWTVP